MRTASIFSAGLLLAVGALTVAAQNPLKLATKARVDLLGYTSVGYLTNGLVVLGDGMIERQGWQTAAVKPRSYTANLNIARYAWNEFKIRFLPQRTGLVTLTLLGPWEVDPVSGLVYQQEVLWDALAATGATITNGSFETIEAGEIAGWIGGISQTGTTNVPAVNGSLVARAWYEGAMSCDIAVTGGVEVVLHFFARAVTPTNFTDMKRVLGNSPAHQAALKFMRGVNMGNYLEARLGTWPEISYSAQDFALARSNGFDHIRLPVDWTLYLSSPTATNNPINEEEIFPLVDFFVTNALDQGLGIIIDLHHYTNNAFNANITNYTAQFLGIWEQIANYYAIAPPEVAFELINEPFGSAATNPTTANLNRVYVEAIRRIRLTNPTRTIFVAPGDYNGMDELENVMLPDNESNVIVTVHCYQPFYFTHQGAEWTGPDTTTTNVVFPGPPATPITLKPPATNAWVVSWFNDYNTLPAEYNPSSTRAFIFKMQRMRQWADYFGRPVYVGEFGCYAKFTPKQSRLNYYQAVRKVMDEQGLGWATWDWKSGFNYINRLTYQPDPPGMKDAMFPPIQLRATRQGTIESDAAAGKNFVVERRLTLSPTNGWQPVATQTLASPKFLYQDPGTNQNKTGFYRVKWQY